MHRIAHPSAVGTLPGVTYTPGSDGFFTEGNPAAALDATTVTADWLNMLQEELRNVIVGAGITPATASAIDNTQLLAAIIALSQQSSPTALKNTYINAFRIQQGTDLARGLMVDGIADDFTDASGVDFVASTNAFVDTAGGYVNAGSIVVPNTASWTISSGNATHWTFGPGSAVQNQSQIGARLSTAISGDFVLTAQLTSVGGVASGFEWQAGLFATSELATWIPDGIRSNMTAMTNSFYIVGDGVGAPVSRGQGATTANIANLLANETFEWERVGGTITLKRNSVLAHTYTGSFTGDLYFVLGGDVAGDTWANISLEQGDPTASYTLVTNAATAGVSPSAGTVYLVIENPGLAPINSQYVIAISRDNGVTWTDVTMVEDGAYSTGGTLRFLTGTASFTGPAGTQIRARATKTATTDIRTHALGVSW